MKLIQSVAFRIACKLATRKPVPQRYSLSNDPENRPDFTFFRFNAKDAESGYDFLATSVREEGIEGVFVGSKPEKHGDGCLKFDQIRDPSYEIARIFRTVAVKYETPIRYILGEVIQRHRLGYWREKRLQNSFNRNFRFRAERMSTLGDLVALHQRKMSDLKLLDFRDRDFDAMDAFTELYTDRVWGHPMTNKYLGEFEFILQSLVSSGELRFENHRYEVQGKALQTLSEYAEDQKRLADQVRHNWIIVWLTVVLALSALSQLPWPAIAGALFD